MKNFMILCFAFSVLMIQSCAESNPDPQNAVEIKGRSDQEAKNGEKPTDNLKANAIAEGDAVGRAKWSLGRVQEELNASAGKVDGLGKVSILLDDNMLMIIRNEVDGNTYEKRVNLANLSSDAKRMEFVVDGVEGAHNPGVKIPILEGKAPVGIFKNGSETSTEKYLELLLGERRQVQLVVSAMTHAIKVSQGDLSI